LTQPEVRKTRAERLAMPLAREVVKDLAVEHGACIRPVQLRRTDLDTGAVEQVLVPCGYTLASVRPACAERAKTLRAAQCREGWHLEAEPVIEPDEPTEDQRWWIEKRAEAQAMRAFGNRPSPLRLETRHPRRPGPHGIRPAAVARRRRPHAMADSTHRS
jgi:hypothetical protein